jgi:hypothetical protein
MANRKEDRANPRAFPAPAESVQAKTFFEVVDDVPGFTPFCFAFDRPIQVCHGTSNFTPGLEWDGPWTSPAHSSGKDATIPMASPSHPCHAELSHREVKMTLKESDFWNTVDTYVFREYEFNTSRLRLDDHGKSYTLEVNKLGVANSERVFTIFMNQFSNSVLTGRLHEAIVRNIADELRRFAEPSPPRAVLFS